MADEVIKFIFREAKLTDSILFFDECEQIFMSREKGGREVNLLLTEIERHDGLIIMVGCSLSDNYEKNIFCLFLTTVFFKGNQSSV